MPEPVLLNANDADFEPLKRMIDYRLSQSAVMTQLLLLTLWQALKLPKRLCGAMTMTLVTHNLAMAMTLAGLPSPLT